MLLVLCGSFYLCHRYAHSLADPLDHRFSIQLPLSTPAVFFAAGHRFGTTDIEEIPGLKAFIWRQVDHFDLSNIPDDVELSPLTTPFELTHLYNIYATGLFWRLFGVSVASLLLLNASLFATTALAIYGVFRLGMGRVGALIATALTCTAPPMLFMSPILREFSKAPFMICAMGILIAAVLRPLTAGKLLLLSALLGLVVGVGLGFRQDLLICLPPALMVLLFGIRLKATRPCSMRLVAVLVFLVAFIPLFLPVYKGMRLEGGQVGVHTFFQGLAPYIEGEMAFGGASYTHMGARDTEIFAQIETYARRQGYTATMENPRTAAYRRKEGDRQAPIDVDPGLLFTGPQYARFGREMIQHMLILQPADLVARAWRSSVAFTGVFRAMAFEIEKIEADFPGWLGTTLAFHAVLSVLLQHYGFWLILVFLMVTAMYRFREACWLGVMLLWFSGYPSLLFEYRNFFHLAFIPFGALILTLYWLVRAVAHSWREGAQGRIFPLHRHGAHAVRIIGFALLAVGIYVAPLAVLRIWQQRQVNAWANLLSGTSLEQVAVEKRPWDHGHILFSPKEVLPGLAHSDRLEPGKTAWEYLAVVFDTHGYDIPLVIQYDEERKLNDYSVKSVLYGCDGTTRGQVTFYFPVYNNTLYEPVYFAAFIEQIQARPWVEFLEASTVPPQQQSWLQPSRFLGVRFHEEYLKFFVGMYRVQDLEALSLLPIFQVPEVRECLRAYKTGPWERGVRRAVHRLISKTGCTMRLVHGCPESSKWDASHERKLSPDSAYKVWELDEDFLRHQHPDSYSFPLLSEDDPVTYLEAWERRLAFTPDLSKEAAEDLARAGTVWFSGGDVEAAIAAYRQALLHSPQNALFHMRLGQLLVYHNAPRDALRHFKEALLIEPLLTRTANRADELFEQLGDGTARAHFWSAISSAHVEQWLAGMCAGESFEAIGDIPQAARMYARVHRAHPEHPDTALALARCRGLLGEVGVALALVEAAVSNHPDRMPVAGGILRHVGEYLIEIKAWDSANILLLMTTQLLPGEVWGHILLGDVCRHLNDRAAAISSYRQAQGLVREGDEGLAKLILDRLEAVRQATGDERDTPV